jgi:glutamine---fructose-6-phosphate transaminase (isomerizing)
LLAQLRAKRGWATAPQHSTSSLARSDKKAIHLKTFAYDQQLQSMPAVITDLMSLPHSPALNPQRPIIFAGIGTSLHAAKVAADWVAQLSGGNARAFAADAHDVGTGAFPLTAQDQLIVISHRGKKIYPNASLKRARELGCYTVSIVGQTAPEQDADVTLRTCANETAGTFSVSYLASLAVLAQIVAKTFLNASAAFAAGLKLLPAAVEDSLSQKPAARWVDAFAKTTPILITGFGIDLPTAQEAALKIKEGAWLWTEAMSPEFAIHGTPASFHPGLSAIVMKPAMSDGGRTDVLLSILSKLNMATVATCGPVGSGADLTFAQAPHPLLRPFLAILPFHLLTVELARVLGTDPDTLHGHREPWKSVMTELKL